MTDPFANFEGGRGALIKEVKRQFVPDWRGIHGASHWARVWTNAQRIALVTGADLGVLELFAWLHDSKRWGDGRDLDHGPRAAIYLDEMRGRFFELSDERFELLRSACELHTTGETQADLTVMTCWDADRLDLGRVGIRPDPRYLCTEVAKDPEMIRWALGRSLDGAEERGGQ